MALHINPVTHSQKLHHVTVISTDRHINTHIISTINCINIIPGVTVRFMSLRAANPEIWKQKQWFILRTATCCTFSSNYSNGCDRTNKLYNYAGNTAIPCLRSYRSMGPPPRKGEHRGGHIPGSVMVRWAPAYLQFFRWHLAYWQPVHFEKIMIHKRQYLT